MVRLATAFGIAVLIHAAVLFTDTRWPLRQPPRLANRQVLTMQLVARQPYRPPALRQLPKPPPPLPTEPPAPPKPMPQKPVVSKPVASPKPVVDQPKPAPAKPIVNDTPPPIVEAPAPEPATVDPLPETPLAPSPETTVETAVSNAATEATPSPAADATVVMARPRYRDNPLPVYPRIARKRGIQGTVILDVFVEADGRVGDLHVAESSRHTMLDRAAMKTVRRWLFEPGHEGKQAVAMWVRVPVDFRLQ